MAPTIISITFEIDAQNHKDGHFSVPRGVCNLLGLQAGDDIALFIKSSSRTLEITKKLSSGTEIYGSDIAECVKAGERITVTASCPS